MIHRVLYFDAFCISVADGWEDVTETLDDTDAPWTVADPVAGVGALQLSPAIYKGGELPRIGPLDLSALLGDFASRRGLDDPFDRTTYSDEVAIEGVSFHSGEDLIRVWYASDGRSIMLVTYVCEWCHRDREALQAEMAVRSIRFATVTDQESR